MATGVNCDDELLLEKLTHDATKLYREFKEQQKSRPEIKNVWSRNRNVAFVAKEEQMRFLSEVASLAMYNKQPVHHEHNTRNRKAPKDPVIPTWRKQVKLPQVSRLPPARYYSYTPHNVLVEDQKALGNIPYFDDETATEGNEFIRNIIEIHDGNIHSASVVQEDEAFLKLVNELDYKANNRGTRFSLRSISRRQSQPVPIDEINEVVFEAISRAFPSEGCPGDLKDRYKKLAKIIYNPNIDGSSALSVTRERSLHTFKSLFCRRCLIYDCHLHAAEMDLPADKLSLIIIRRTESFIEQTPKNRLKLPCSEKCYVHYLNDNPSKVPLDFISKADESIIRAEWTSSPGNFCFINTLIYKKSVTCHMVYFWCKKEIDDFAIYPHPNANHFYPPDGVKCNGISNGNRITGEVANFDDESNCSYNSIASSSGHVNGSLPHDGHVSHVINRSDAPKRKSSLGSKGFYSSKRKKNPFNSIRNELKSKSKSEKNETTQLHNYTPCSDHIGEECSIDNCECIRKATFCEKYCLCSSQCQYRIPGCRCTSNCTTNQCPCFKASRECDPDLCKPCGAGDYPEPKKCSNVLLQRMKKKHLLIAPSDLGFDAGWGCFTKERINRNELISEYCGEVISQLEADRRGIIYDKHKISFLFQLNSEFSVDATVKGNKIRFANHSVNPNCFARVCRVNGEHRIGIFAKRDIEKGEELFFDYKYGSNERIIFVPIEQHVPVASRGDSYGPKNNSNGKEGTHQSRVSVTARNTAIKSAPKNGSRNCKATSYVNAYTTRTNSAKGTHIN